MERETIDVLEGPEAVATYGICCCPRATIQNQEWHLIRDTRIDREGDTVTAIHVRCGFCSRVPGQK